MKTIVLIVTDESSAVVFYKGYARFLREHGWEVIVITKSQGDIEDWASNEGATAFSVDLTRDPSVLLDLKALWQMYRLLKSLKPSVVVSATPKAGLLGTLAAKLARVPTRIYQLWGLRLESETGLTRRILWTAERVAMWASTQCVANSVSLASVTESLGIAPEGSITVLGSGSSHGVDLKRFSPDMAPEPDAVAAEFLAAEADLTVVFVGRLTPDKGIDTLLTALDTTRAKGVDVRALLVGEVENEGVGAVIAQAPDYIHATGDVLDVRPYIDSADVLCLPTLREGFPNVVLEAAALERPAVVSDATGAIDSVVDGETGWVFPVGDADALATIFGDISAAPELRLQRGHSARRRVVDEFEQVQMWELQLHNIESQVQNKAPGKARAS